MVLKRKSVNWDKIALKQLGDACNYIRKDSLKNAKKVRKDILANVHNLASHPEKYPLDKYKLNNDSTYRAFELHHYRIVYRVLQTEIKIITVRHTSMEPAEY